MRIGKSYKQEAEEGKIFKKFRKNFHGFTEYE